MLHMSFKLYRRILFSYYVSLKQGGNCVELGCEYGAYVQDREADPESETQRNRQTAVDHRSKRYYHARAYEGKF